ncbi:hypothetical protein ACIP5Z_05725 [Rothia terrae]|uniref:hypothetical protein n=1 Tax=Rothia terrae TaxID=396015 RepID=UPI00382DDBF8
MSLPPPPHTPAVDAEAQSEKVKIWRRATWLSILIGFVVLTNTTALAWVGSIFFTLGIVCASITMAKISALKPPTTVYVLYSMVIVFCVMMLLSSLVTAIFSGVSTQYQDCIEQATTITRTQQCSGKMEDNLLNTLTGK